MKRQPATRRRTLRGRVSLVAIAVLAGWLIILTVGLGMTLSSRLDQQIDDTLRVRAQAASTVVEISHGSLVGVRESATDKELDTGIYVFAGDRAVAQPHTSARSAHAAAELADSPTRYATRGDRRFYVLPLQDNGHRVGSVVAVLETDPYTETKNFAILASAAVAVLLLAGAYPVLRGATARALRPVEAMTEQAAEWSVGSPTGRFGADQEYAELRSLAATLDDLLDRVTALSRHERQLTAELSHELRTPLARMMTEADVALYGSAEDHRAALLAIRQSCAAIDSMIDTLMAAARTEHARTVGHADLDAVLAMFTTPAGSDPAVTAARTGIDVSVDADVLARILAPIVDNAVRFAASTVQLAGHREGSTAVVTVANDGPVLPAEYAARIFEPGFRAAPDDEHDGAGLGLSLALRLARAADGDIDVDPKAANTTFRVILPAGADAGGADAETRRSPHS